MRWLRYNFLPPLYCFNSYETVCFVLPHRMIATIFRGLRDKKCKSREAACNYGLTSRGWLREHHKAVARSYARSVQSYTRPGIYTWIANLWLQSIATDTKGSLVPAEAPNLLLFQRKWGALTQRVSVFMNDVEQTKVPFHMSSFSPRGTFSTLTHCGHLYKHRTLPFYTFVYLKEYHHNDSSLYEYFILGFNIEWWNVECYIAVYGAETWKLGEFWNVVSETNV